MFPFRLPHQCDTGQGGERGINDVRNDREIVRPNQMSVSHCFGSVACPFDNEG
jgi:hypothetical protein